MTESVKCEACSTVSAKDEVHTYTDGWSCSECNYFNSSNSENTEPVSDTNSDTVFRTVESEESTNDTPEIPEEIVRMISTLLILGVIQFIVNLPLILIGAFAIFVCILGCTEYIYVKSLSKESRAEYREKRKTFQQHRRSEFVGFLGSAIFVIGLLISVFYTLDLIIS